MISDSMILTKEEMVVLMDILKLSKLPGIQYGLPNVSGSQYARIAKAFYDSGALIREGSCLRMDKGMARFLIPLEKCRKILLCSTGENGISTSRIGVYFASQGAVALREVDDERLEFLWIGSAAELMLLLPALRPGAATVHSSHWLFTEEAATACVATLAPRAELVEIIESRRENGEAQARENRFTRSPGDYAAWWKNRLKEVYHVSDR